jgi:ADP-ribosylglycohydrolase
MEMRKISYEQYLDKIWGGWVGKCAGGILGAPIEGFKCFHSIQFSEELFKTNYPNDDLDLQVLWLDLAKKKGPWIDENDLGQHWLDHVEFPWNEYGIAFRNMSLGIMPPLSGKHNNTYYNQSMGSPIRSEIWGMLCAGNPELAAHYAKMDASIDHSNFSVEAEMFLSACEAEAFFEPDIQKILERAISIFPENSSITNLYNKVAEFNLNCTPEIAKHKIKSYFGDADFTSAPQNVAFAIHTLLNYPVHLESVMEAVNMGHDSDCISATVGGLLGTIIGYKNLDTQWKQFVGDELLISPGITGIEAAETVSELAIQTANAGLSFAQLLGNCEITDTPTLSILNFKKKPISVVQTDIIKSEKNYWITFEIRNNEPDKKTVSVKLVSEVLNFINKKIIEISAGGNETVTFEMQIDCIQSGQSNFPYQFMVQDEKGISETFNFGIPNYGEWLMLGPFIEDNKALIPMHPVFPDHGLSSMPSIPYMNHDLLSPEKEWLTCGQIQKIMNEKTGSAQPFLVTKVTPDSNHFKLEQYYVGRGERTLYLATKIISEKEQQKWLCFAAEACITLWVNEKEMARVEGIKRSWPMENGVLIDLNEGENLIIFRLDCPLDNIHFQAGFKEFKQAHYHQSMWNTNLIPTLK